MKKILIFLLIFTFLLKLPSLFEPDWYTDEAIYLTIGQSLSKGAILYKDIADNKPPFIYSISQLARNLFNLKLILLVWTIATVYIFYKIASFQKNPYISFFFAIFIASPLFEGNIANGEVFMLLPILATLYFLLTQANPKYFLLGLLGGLALLVKYTAIFDIIALSFLILLKTKSIFRFFKFLLATQVPIFITYLYFVSLGSATDFLENVFLKNSAYISSWDTSSHTGLVLTMPLLTRVVLLIISISTLLVFYYKKKLSKFSTFALLWFCLALFSARLSGRPYPHYFIQLTLPVSILLLNLLLLNKKLKYLLLLFLLFVSALILDLHQKFYNSYPVGGYYKNFLKGSNPTYFPKDTQSLYHLSTYVNQNTSEATKLLVWSNNPQFYYLSKRLPLYKYFTYFMVQDWGNQQDLKNLFMANLPAVILEKGYILPEPILSVTNKYYKISYIYNNYSVLLPR